MEVVSMQYIGMDVHKSFSYACVMDEGGSVIMSEKIPNEQQAIDKFIPRLEPNSKIVMEASSCWEYLYDYLEEHRFDMSLANPLKLKAIASARIKTDRIDAEILAHLLRTNLIPESYVAPQNVRDERQVVRLRASLVNIRVQVKNKIHALLAKHGITYQFSDLFGKAGIEFLQTLELPAASRFELDQYLTLLQVLDEKINTVQKQIEGMATDNYHAKLLMTIPGISYYSALMIMSEIGDITRFHSKKHLCSFAGLVPSVYQSGNTRRTGHITKQGSSWLRWILIQAANRAIYTNSALRKFYLELNKRKGHKTAIVATARKMLIYMYMMLRLNIPFHALQVNKKMPLCDRHPRRYA
jgi:transposase